MPTDDDYGRRERLLLHQHTATQFGPSSISSSSQQSQSQSQPHSHFHSHPHPHSIHPHVPLLQSSSSIVSSSTQSGVPSVYLQERGGQSDGDQHSARYGGVHRVQDRYEKSSPETLQQPQQQQQQQQQISSNDGYGILQNHPERYPQLPGLQGYHQFTVGSSNLGRFSLFGDQDITDSRLLQQDQRYQQQQQQQQSAVGERFLQGHQVSGLISKDDGVHYASPGSGILLSSELFPSPPSPAPTNDRFIPPPPLSPTPSEKYASSQSLSGYHQNQQDIGGCVIPSGSPGGKQDRFGTAPASPMPSGGGGSCGNNKERFASAERLLANSSPVLGSQGLYGGGTSSTSSGGGVVGQTKDVSCRYGSISSERLLSGSPIHAPVPERFACGSRSSEKLQSPRHERYHHEVNGRDRDRDRERERERYGTPQNADRYLSSSPNPEGAHQRYSSTERVLVPSPAPENNSSQSSRRYSTSDQQQQQQRYVNDQRPGGSPGPCSSGEYGNSSRVVALQDAVRFGDILSQRYGQSRMDRFVVSAEHLASSCSQSERLLGSSTGGTSSSTSSSSSSNPIMVNRYHSNSPYGVQTSPCGDRLSPTPETGVSLPSNNGVRLSYGAIQQSSNNKNTEKYFTTSSKSNQNYNNDRYQLSSGQNVPQERSSRLDRFHAACNNIGVQNSSGSSSGSNQISDSRYSPGRSSDKSYLSLPKPKDRFPSTGRVGVIGAPVNSSSSSSSSSGCNNNGNNNTVGNDRAYASAHTPVERYVPQPPPEILYPGYADLYIPPSAHTPTDRYVPAVDPGDPYMRRDLGFHHHYRLPPPGYPYHHQSHFRFRGFAYAASPQGRMGGSPGSSSSTSSTTSVQREFTTSPLLRQKSRGNNTEFNSSTTGPIPTNQRHTSSGTNHLPCCSEQNSQPPSQSQRVCCQPSRRSMPPPCNAGNVTNIPTQNSNPHTSWQPSPGSGTTSTSTVSSSGQDVGIGVTSQSISMYAVAVPGSGNGTGSTCSSVGGGGGGGSGNGTGTAGIGIAGIQGIGIMPGGGVGGGSSSKISESSQNPSSTTTSPPPPVPLTTVTSGAGNSSNLSRSASAPTGPPRPVIATPSFVSHRNENQNQRLQRTISRTDAIKNYIKRETATFFGVDEDSEAQEKQRWLERRRRMASRKYGALLPEHRPPDPDITRDVPDASEIPEGVTLRRWHQPVRRKDSVARMTLSGLSYMVTTMTRHRPRERDETRPESRSFPPSTVPLNNVGGGGGSTSPEVTADEEEEAFFERPPPPSPAITNQQQIINDHNIQGINSSTPLAQQDDLLNNGSSTAHDLDDGAAAISALSSCTADTVDATSSSHSVERDLSEELVRFTIPKEEGISSSEILSRRPRQISRDHYTSRTSSWRRSRDPGGAPEGLGNASSGEAVTLRRQAISGTRISPNTIDRIFDNSNRRQYGMGIVGRFFGRSFRKSVAHKPHVKKQLDDIEDQRPFFTYWITTVQVLILVISLACYGFGPFGFELSHRTGSVLVTSLSLQQVDYQEPANFWIGPRAADLIHLGAKFAPCMRRDIKILKEIDVWRERERDTACCIRNDDSGCVQSSKQDCSNTISTWKKWGPGDSGPGGRISGSVCGLDPKFCDAPASIAPYEWPDDITKWPICRKTNPFNQRFSKGGSNQMFPVSRHMDKMAEHMVCEVIGHPCCIGIHGMCRITTKEYCDFVHGYFHEEASLCSQVECLHDVCGMIPFLHPEWPDQFYRLFTSIFLHAGIFHLAITLCVQYFFMRDLEKLTGSFRIAIIYLTGGLAGNLASAIFVPYRAEVGPAGAHFALLATLVVEVLNSWPMLKHPRRALSKLLISLFALLILGALPWIDNYAHLFGFVFGFLAAYAVMPFISFGRYDRRRKILLIWICLILIVGLFAMLLALFYNVPAYECEICKLFTCIPFTKDFCASQNINFKREEPV